MKTLNSVEDFFLLDHLSKKKKRKKKYVSFLYVRFPYLITTSLSSFELTLRTVGCQKS